MSLLESFELAIKNIFASKMRAFLTMLGIIIGIMAVMLIVGIGSGVKVYMKNQFSSIGTNTLTVQITGRGSSRNITVDEMYQLVKKNPNYLAKVSPTVSVSSTVKVGDVKLSSTTVTGVSEEYFDMKNYTISIGRSLNYMDVVKRHKVCVIGSYIASDYYGTGFDALDKTIKIGGNDYTIVGVVDELASSEEGSSDDAVFLPYTTAARLSYTGKISSYLFTVVSEDQATKSKSIIESALYAVYNSSDDYHVQSMTEMLNMMTNMISVLVIVLTAIAAISLLVGGIGIMNIMLVSVTERTREIGIRKALGAKENVIMTQFVIEAATTSALGGIFGIVAGYGVSSIATVAIKSIASTDIPVTPSMTSVFVAFGVSAAIGILFGYLPAKRAAVLNPIDALHYD